LERLLAEVNARPLRRSLQIELFNRTADFGTSPIYDPAQPEYILVNVSIGELDFWTPVDPPIAAGKGPSFVDWYHGTFSPEAPLTGNEYLSRAVVGRYLIDCFRRIRNALPPGVTVRSHVGEVVDIEPGDLGYKIHFAGRNDRVEIRADKILLATGHSRIVPDPEEKRYQEFGVRHSGAAFIPFVYPVVESMASIPRGAKVAFKGVGLSFIDAVLELTEGRGGSFERVAGGWLSYTASGNEPLSIIPFSRSGLPMAPKADDLPPFMRPLTFFTPEALAEIRQQKGGQKLDFDRDLLPLFKLEMELQYYRVLMRTDKGVEPLESSGNDAEAMHRVVDSYLLENPSRKRFDFTEAFDPIGERCFDSGKEFAVFVEKYMEREIARARLGQGGCGVKAAVDIWYEVRKVLGSVLKFGGLSPESHRRVLEYYFPRLKRIVFGPPTINIEKLLALVRAGLVDFSVARNPRVLPDETYGCFELRCDDIPGAVARAEVLVDARYPAPNMLRDAMPLYRNLYNRGMLRPYQNRTPLSNGPRYSPGAIDMTERFHFVVDSNGVGNEDISVIGIPTEGNLVGNKNLARDDYSGVWAAEVVRQLRCRERALEDDLVTTSGLVDSSWDA